MDGRRLMTAAAMCIAAALVLHAAGPLDKVLAAFSANQAAATNRSRLTIDVNGVVDEYVIERVKPDRLRVVHNPGRTDAQESVIIGATMYVRQPGGWISGAAVAPIKGTIPSLDELLKSGISDLKESSSSGSTRGTDRFSGRMKWSNGGVTNEGLIDILIDVRTTMLRTVTFRGTCATKPCRFQQEFSYDPRLTIAAPK